MHTHMGTCMQEWKIMQYCILMDQYQNVATLYVLNQKCMILIIEKSKRRDVIRYPYKSCLCIFGIAIPTSSCNFIQLFFMLVLINYCVHAWDWNSHVHAMIMLCLDIADTCRSLYKEGRQSEWGDTLPLPTRTTCSSETCQQELT